MESHITLVKKQTCTKYVKQQKQPKTKQHSTTSKILSG